VLGSKGGVFHWWFPQWKWLKIISNGRIAIPFRGCIKGKSIPNPDQAWGHIPYVESVVCLWSQKSQKSKIPSLPNAHVPIFDASISPIFPIGASSKVVLTNNRRRWAKGHSKNLLSWFVAPITRVFGDGTWYTPWLFNIAMENRPFIDDKNDDVPIKNGDFS